MTGNVIQIHEFRRGNVRCSQTGLVFPQLYRFTGFHFCFKKGAEADGCFIRSFDDLQINYDAPAAPAYTLDPTNECSRIGEPHWEPISHLSEMDTGLVYVRHHKDRIRMEAYIDAMIDTGDFVLNDRWNCFQTSVGFFTVLHRPPMPEGLDRAVVYVTKAVDDRFGEMDWYMVIDSEGNERSFDDLLAAEVQEHLAPLLEQLNSVE